MKLLARHERVIRPSNKLGKYGERDCYELWDTPVGLMVFICVNYYDGQNNYDGYSDDYWKSLKNAGYDVGTLLNELREKEIGGSGDGS